MNYLKLYRNLIKKSSNRKLTGYSEKHHIIPKSCGGSNHSYNIVKLTAREHFIAHRLLVKICERMYGINHNYTVKMRYALNNFIIRKSCDKSDYKITARTYERLRKEYSDFISSRYKHIGNPNFKLCKHYNKIAKKSYCFTKGKTWEQIYGVEEAEKRRQKLRNTDIHKNFGKGLFIKTKKHKENISKSLMGKQKNISKEERLRRSQHAKKFIGENNPNSKKFTIINPKGKVFNIKGNLKEFCLNNNLSLSVFYKYKNTKIKNGKNKDWILLDG